MNQLKSRIQKLVDASNNGEDNSVMLALVEEIANELKASMPNQVASSVISVVMPNGYRPSVAPREVEAVHSAPSGFSMPKPPNRIVEETVEVAELPLEVADPPEVVSIAATAKPAPAVEPKVIEVAEEVTPPVVIQGVEYEGGVEVFNPIAQRYKDAPHEAKEVPIAEETPTTLEKILGDWKIQENGAIVPDQSGNRTPAPNGHMEVHTLELTAEMIEEATTLERLSLNPEMEPEWQGNTVVESKPEPRDLNEKLAQRTKVLNEVFSQPEPEVVTQLKETRILDLRKAISINEKYQYINSLFRGDEDMFERSIKTLNNFSIMPEADYWMQRELLIKLGWNDEDELVQRFFSLVRRRFS